VRRRALVGGAAAALVLASGGLAVAASGAGLAAQGPVHLDGTTADAVFTLGERTIRQFHYADRQELGYTFTLHNTGPLPVTVVDVSAAGPEATLLRVDRLQRAATGATRFEVPAGARVPVRLVVDMTDCERVSSRAGSFLSEVSVSTEVGGMLDRSTVVALPEELHTGSPREGGCPRATASSRSPG
jgi:hypothetical protein